MAQSSNDSDASPNDRPDSGDIGTAFRQVRDTARAAGETVRQTALEQGNEAVLKSKEGVAGQIDVLVAAVEASAEKLHGSESPLASAADSVAGFLRSSARHLHEQNPKALAHEVSDFARTHPLVFLLGSAAAGFALARVAKAGTPEASRNEETPA